MFTINYGTGAGNETASSLEQAKKSADENCCWTRCDINIITPEGIILRRKWYGVQFDAETDESEDPILFGSGYYADWEYLN